MKKFAWFSIAGALVVVTLVTWFGPNLISWWFTPPVDTLFNCKGPIEWALKRFQLSQVVGLVSGALLGFFASFLVKGRNDALVP